MSFKKEIILREEKGPIVELFGELDIYASNSFKEDMLKILEDYNDHIYLDFKNLDYIDSTGLGALISILKAAQETERKVYLKDVNERIRKLFKITAIEEMFIFEGGIDE